MASGSGTKPDDTKPPADDKTDDDSTAQTARIKKIFHEAMDEWFESKREKGRTDEGDATARKRGSLFGSIFD